MIVNNSRCRRYYIIKNDIILYFRKNIEFQTVGNVICQHVFSVLSLFLNGHNLVRNNGSYYFVNVPTLFMNHNVGKQLFTRHQGINITIKQKRGVSRSLCCECFTIIITVLTEFMENPKIINQNIK